MIDQRPEIPFFQPKPTLDRPKDKKKEEEMVVKKTDSAVAPVSLTNRMVSARSNGKALPVKTLTEMNSSFGTDFSRVNIHNGREAVEMNNELHARAFTYGNDIYFNKGKYHPETSAGKHLLAHELTHVVQQQGIANSVQRFPLVNSKAESDVENDRESFSIILARHYLTNQRNVPFDPAQTTKCTLYGTHSHECLLITKSGTSIKLIWNTKTNVAIAKAIINKEGLACGFNYSVDNKSEITFSLIKCWAIFDI